MTDKTSETQFVFVHAKTLNALCEMQESIAYAARKQVLVDAENAIVTLERALAAARQQLVLAEARTVERCAKVCEGESLGEDVDNDCDRAYNLAIRHATDAIRAAAAKLPETRDVMAERWKVIEMLWTDSGLELNFNGKGWPTLFCEGAETASISRTGKSPEEIIDKLAAEFAAASKGAGDE